MKKIVPKEADASAMMSHVMRKFVSMDKYPPMIGATVLPNPYAVLKMPEALSFIVPDSLIPSFSLTLSMICGSSGTNMFAHAKPSSASPIEERYRVLISIT